MNRILTTALLVLTLSAPALADTIPAGARVFGSQPSGTGEPTAISCYRASMTGTHATKMVCHRNSEWARANAALAPIDGRPTSTYVQGGPANQ